MTLNHINLTVTDVLEAKKLLEKYFGLKAQGGGKKMAFLSDDKGLILTLMKPTAETEATYPRDFHIGFIVENEEKVNEINRHLKSDGFDVPEPQKLHAWTFYFKTPGGFTVEVMA